MQGENLTEAINQLGTYEIVDHRYLEDIGSDSYVLRHRKSGARIAILPNTDSNKVFYIAFRTPPRDSTGVAHIIEHTVLCGSRDFPVKDPFIEVVKGSLNTFLNAMTYPDKTVYPVASTNEKDFDNLMHVYLDAVLHPNIYSNENIFRQEGWHYEVADAGETGSGSGAEGSTGGKPEITVNGVVYNEMKGVMSSPDDVLNDEVLASLFPDTTYAIVSGGDPAVIPTLTYENYLNFHRHYYHPSNAYLYLYGDMDMVERLRYIDEAYLSQYDHDPVDSTIHGQAPFAVPVEAEKAYSIQKNEDPSGKSYLSWNVALPIREDPETVLAFMVLDYVLCDAEGAPVKEALRKKGIGLDVSSLYEAGLYEPYYSVTARYTDPERKQEFEATIRETLEGLVSHGIDGKSLRAGINYYEFHYREADFGSYPKGLIYGLDVMDTWLYDDKAVWTNLEVGPYFDELKKKVGTGYYEGLIRKYLLDNPHRSVVILKPEQGLTERNEAAQREKMRAFADSLSADELQKIRDAEASLRKWQETPDTEEHLNTIPVLERSDLKKEIIKPENEFIPLNTSVQGSLWDGLHAEGIQAESGRVNLLVQPVFTSGIDYVSISFDITNLPERLMKWVSVYKVLLCALDTEHYSYGELDNEINIVTGGMTPAVSDINMVSDPSSYRILYTLTFKAMDANLKEAVNLAEEVLLRTSFENMDRIREVLEEETASMKNDLASSGHMTAVMRAQSYLSPESKIIDDIVGIGAYRFLKELCGNWAAHQTELKAAMEEMTSVIFTRERMLISVTAEDEAVRKNLAVYEKLAEDIPSGTSKDAAEEPYRPVPVKRNEGFTTAGQVQFVCRAGNYYNKGLRFNGSLRVLKVILGYDYLWTRIRMKGGAYGCMSGFGRDGGSYFVTYRDPHLKQSIRTFEEAADYIRHFDADERTMTKYVIGAVSSLDRPMTPSQFGHFSRLCVVSGLTAEEMQRERDETLNCSVEDIRRTADYIDAFMQDDVLCVVGSEGKIESGRELFGEVTALE